MTYAEQALNHAEISSGNPWEDCFCNFPLHPYSTGIRYSGGTLQVDGGWAVVFADNSMLLWRDDRKEWQETTWSAEEAFLGHLSPDEIKEVKTIIERDLAEINRVYKEQGGQ